VAPYALVQHQGRWMVAAVETATGRSKTFLLSRVTGPVRLTTRTLDVPEGCTAGAALAELDRLWDERRAVVAVAPGSDAETRLTKRRGSVRRGDDALEVHFVDLHVLAEELASFGPEVLVREPSELRDLVDRRLRRVVAAHAGGPRG